MESILFYYVTLSMPVSKEETVFGAKIGISGGGGGGGGYMVNNCSSQFDEVL